MKKLLNSKKHILLTFSFMLFALMVLVASLHENGLLAVYRMEGELSKLQTNNESLKFQNERLRLEVQTLKTDSVGIEKIAREKLDLVKPGELIFRIIPSPNPLELPKASSNP